jgi:hypothetical protein
MAAALASSLVKVEPENEAWWINLAYSVRRSEGIEQAEAILLRARAIHPKVAMIAFNLACYASVTGRMEDAKERLRNAIDLHKDVPKLAIDDNVLKPFFAVWMELIPEPVQVVFDDHSGCAHAMTIEQVTSYLPDLPTIIQILAVAALSWWTRGRFDRRTERASLRREIFREYMAITGSNSNRLYALRRSGATRLEKGDFQKLVSELSKAGRPPLKDSESDLISDLGLYEALCIADRHQMEFNSDHELNRWILQEMAERADKGLSSDVRSALKGLKKGR